MQSLTPQAAEIFAAAVDAIPEDTGHAIIDRNPGTYMALHVEHIGNRKPFMVYSFAHYYEQNGDLMRDPDVIMLCYVPMAPGAPKTFYPIAYRQDGLGIDAEYVSFDSDNTNTYRIQRKLQKSLADFCNSWAEILQNQQDLTAASGSGKVSHTQAAEGR